MGYFYFDDSVHDPKRGDFVLGALVYSKQNLEPIIATKMTSVGLSSGVDEFKSGARKNDNLPMTELRSLLKDILRVHCKIAITVIPRNNREQLGKEGLECLTKVIRSNSLSEASHEVFFDEGCFKSRTEADKLFKEKFNDQLIIFHPEQDSKTILGIQIADLVAHTCSIMLLEELGLINKTVKAGENSGYDPEMDIELGFEMWASLRYNFFNGGICIDAEKEDYQTEDFTANVADYGLHIANTCSKALKFHTESRFGSVYLGCIH